MEKREVLLEEVENRYISILADHLIIELKEMETVAQAKRFRALLEEGLKQLEKLGY